MNHIFETAVFMLAAGALLMFLFRKRRRRVDHH